MGNCCGTVPDQSKDAPAPPAAKLAPVPKVPVPPVPKVAVTPGGGSGNTSVLRIAIGAGGAQKAAPAPALEAARSPDATGSSAAAAGGGAAYLPLPAQPLAGAAKTGDVGAQAGELPAGLLAEVEAEVAALEARLARLDGGAGGETAETMAAKVAAKGEEIAAVKRDLGSKSHLAKHKVPSARCLSVVFPLGVFPLPFVA